MRKHTVNVVKGLVAMAAISLGGASRLQAQTICATGPLLDYMVSAGLGAYACDAQALRASQHGLREGWAKPRWTPPANPPVQGPVSRIAEQATVTPEPATLMLLSSGLGGVGVIVRRRRRISRD